MVRPLKCALKCALSHLQGAAACNPYNPILMNPILMNLHAPEQSYLGWGGMEKMKQTLLPLWQAGGELRACP